MRILASILGRYLQERNNDEKITQCLCMQYETYAIISLSTKIIPSPKQTITFASNFEKNVGWRAVLARQIDLFCF